MHASRDMQVATCSTRLDVLATVKKNSKEGLYAFALEALQLWLGVAMVPIV